MSTFARRSRVPVLGLLVAILAVRFVIMLPSAATRRSDGFAAYYTASRLLREHDHVADFYDDEWFNTHVGRIVPGVQDIYRPNPPPAVALALPLAGLNYKHARVVWTTFNLLLLFATLAIIIRETGVSVSLTLAFVALTLAFEPLWVNLRQGQAYIVLLFVSVLCWSAGRRRNDAVAGVALGLMLIFKTAGVLLPLLFLRHRRWRALTAGLITIGLVVLASLFTLGVAPWQAYLKTLWSGRNEPDLMVTAYQSAYSLSHHLFVYDAIWNQNPVMRAPQVGAIMAIIALLGVLIAVGIILARATSDDRSFAALVIAASVISPYSLAYHYCLLLLPIALLASRIESGTSSWRWTALVVGTLLIAMPLPYLSARFEAGGWALIAYPKLVGTLLLLGLTLKESLESAADSATSDDVALIGSEA